MNGKQKGIVALTLFLVAAGSYYVFTRDSSVSASKVSSRAARLHRERQPKKVEKERSRRPKKTRKTARATESRVRQPKVEKKSTARKAKRGKPTKAKKKIVPQC